MRALEAILLDPMEPVRKVCGKPHKTIQNAERGKTSAISWGWDEVKIEPRCNGEYFVVTGIPFPDINHDLKQGISNPLKGRYRWPGK
jgi:hypothetical protein